MFSDFSDEAEEDDCECVLYEFILKVSAEDLPEMDILGSSDPYFILLVNGKQLFTSETIKDDVNPYWKEFEVRYSAFKKTCSSRQNSKKANRPF